ncbi:MAG: glycosyltransferase [Ruminococcus sp.]|nr:glycosyltransferase [Ruminococcus sp.]
MNPIISIIVPIYNGAGLVKKCISSICNQTYHQLEIILIDDGSKDDTLTICQEYANKDSRIVVLHQDNSGVSVARNNGLAHMTGQFVMFVDADDFIDENACKRCLDEIIEKKSDIIIANKIFHIGTKIQKNVLYSKPSFSRSGSEKELFILDLMTTYYDPLMNKVPYLSCGVTAKLFDADIIRKNNIKFKEDCRFGEDVVFNMECFQYANTISYIDFDLYHFCVNSGSSTHKFRDDWNKSHAVFMDCIDLFNDKYQKDERFLHSAEMMKVSRISSLAVSYYFHKDNPKKFISSYKEFTKFVKQEKYAKAVKNVKEYLLTDNQRKIVFLLKHHMLFLFSIICYVRNRIRKV